MNTKKMFESHLKVADPVKTIGGEGSKDDQQTDEVECYMQDTCTNHFEP